MIRKARRVRMGLLLALAAGLIANRVQADDSGTTLIDAKDPAKGWKLNLGWEFKGAKGAIISDHEVDAQYRPAIRLDGDFTGGGNYVGCGRDIPGGAELESMAFWFKGPTGMEQFTLRLIDGTDQCHQFNLKCEPHGGWQRINFPVALYFEKAGTSSAVELVKRYEGWGGAKDGKWHNPLKSIDFLTGWQNFGKDEAGNPKKTGSIWIANAKLTSPAPKIVFNKEVRLDDFIREGELDWGFNQGWEFKGATGGVAIAKSAAQDGGNAARLWSDFTGGGAYVSAEVPLNGLDILTIKSKIKTSNAKSFNVRYIDGTGQCFQGRGFPVEPDGEWHEVEIPVAKVTGGEHWGGANDGTWHGKARSMSIVIGPGAAADKKPELLLADIRADVQSSATASGQPYNEAFNEGNASLPKGWKTTGQAAVITDTPFEGAGALRLERNDTQLNTDLSVTGAIFPAAAGPWSVSGATRSKLYSPDSSFAVRVNLEALDAGGAAIGAQTLVDQTGSAGWKKFAREITLPKGTTQARFTVTTHKTYGWADVDALAAVPLEAKGKEKIIDRIMIGSAATGNLFYPDDPVAFDIEVRALKPLSPASRSITLAATDYWGAEVAEPQTLALIRDGNADGKFRYRAKPAFDKGLFEVGKYYELHTIIRPDGFEDATEYSGFARLPESESKRYQPKEIPFTIRNWDSRLPDYFKLASRIGLRQIGLWGDSGIDAINKQGDMWYSGSGAATVEHSGWEKITREKLREDTYNFVKKHSKNGMLFLVQGNEPPEREDKIDEKIEAYKIVYEASKAADPELPVLATSVPALDSFFKRGFWKYADIYDFHVYETYEGVRNGVRGYKRMQEKYHPGVTKPIWCTELGLNSQGQTRHAVALEVVKKITAFFAEGGANVSWFTIMYPDSSGQARGTSGDAHNTFDCHYCKYNPRLDAIMYYTMINGITVKKFAAERQNENGVQDFLFMDDKTGDCFRVLWHEGGRVDVGVETPKNAKNARLIRIDGSSAPLDFGKGGVTLGISSEPVILQYSAPQATKTLAAVRAPLFSIPSDQPFTILKGQSRSITLAGSSDLVALAPPRWKAEFKNGKLIVTAPAETDARSGRVSVRPKDGSGEITLTLAIMSPVSLDIYAAPANTAGEPQVRLVLKNNGSEPAVVDWQSELDGAFHIRNGMFDMKTPNATTEPYLKGDTEGHATLAPGATQEALVSIADSAEQTLYKIRASVTDATGRKLTVERFVGGFAVAKRRGSAHAATVQKINLAEQNFRFSKDAKVQWKGASDLSAEWTAEWDEQGLYLTVSVTDDAFSAPNANGGLWNQDGLQFLFDPMRISKEKAGKYDYALSNGPKGPQAWCFLSGDSRVNDGEVKEIAFTVSDNPPSPGGKVYRITFPWKRLLPFEPKPGANLGITLIVNEDDGDGRTGFMGWFSGAHSKDLDNVGDLILGE